MEELDQPASNNNNIFFENSNSSSHLSFKADDDDSIVHTNERKRTLSSDSADIASKIKKEKLNSERITDITFDSTNADSGENVRQKRKNYHPFSIFALAELNNDKQSNQNDKVLSETKDFKK